MLQFSRPVIKNKNNNSDSQEDWKRAFSEQDLTRGSPHSVPNQKIKKSLKSFLNSETVSNI